jgi:hypothetical protein
MKTIQFSLLLIWLILLFFNLFLIWKYILKTKKSKSINVVNTKTSSSYFQEDNDIFLKIRRNQLQELSNLIEEIGLEADLAEHHKIQQLSVFFQTNNFPIKNSNIKTLEEVEPTLTEKNRNLKKRLLSIHPDLTEQDLWLSELIIIEKSIIDISLIMKLGEGTVRVYKTRLKLKLNLSLENSLKAYLIKLYEMK